MQIQLTFVVENKIAVGGAIVIVVILHQFIIVL